MKNNNNNKREAREVTADTQRHLVTEIKGRAIAFR